jgi:NAD(P)-dependent dehydrogenase (short-subunit alcohol dehydrogenase family)
VNDDRERGTHVLLEGKNALVYGVGGSIGGAMAREFAREDARMYLAGRIHGTLEAVAGDIETIGGFPGLRESRSYNRTVRQRDGRNVSQL